jgi:hypothetical protein
MRMKVLFCNESTGLTKDGAQGAGIEFDVERNRQDLACSRDFTSQPASRGSRVGRPAGS